MLQNLWSQAQLLKTSKFFSKCFVQQVLNPTPLNPTPATFGHVLRGRSLKGRCNIRVYVPVCVPVCVCPSSPPPHDPAHTVGLKSRIPPTPVHDPSPPFPHPYPQAIARPTLGKNYPLKSARNMPQAKTEVALQFSECCAAEVALQHSLFCSTEVIWTKSCAAADEKLHCNIEKAALQESGAFLPLSCGLQAPTFRHPHKRRQLGPKRPCRGNFCCLPAAVRCGGIGPNQPRKGPHMP